MKEALDFAVLFLRRPSSAADACRRPNAVRLGLIIYAVSAVVSLLTSWFNPLRYVDPNAPALAGQGLGFWAGVAVWEPLLAALGVWFGVLALDWLQEGWLPFKAAVAALWTAVPAFLALTYVSARMHLGRGPFIAGLALWLVPGLILTWRTSARAWREVGAFLLGLNAVQAVGLAVTLVAALARSEELLKAVDVVVLLWLLSVSGLGLRRLRGISTARAVFAVLFSLVLSTTVPVLAFLLGLVPMSVLKVVLYV